MCVKRGHTIADSELIVFLDVGHGDCCLLISPAGKCAAVIDCPDADVAVEFLERYHVDALRYVLATHLDSDHAPGIPSLVANFKGKVDAIYYNSDRISGAGTGYKALLQSLYKLETRGDCEHNRHATVDGEPLELPSLGHAHTTLLYPKKGDLEHFYDKQNNASAVTLIKCRGQRVLLTGDVEKEGCDYLIERYSDDLRADILKIPHHGGWHDSLPSLLDAVSPRFAVVSCGTIGKGNVPRAEALDPLATTFGYVPCVLCTQLTKHCHGAPASVVVELRDSLPEESKIRSVAEQGVPCGGTIRFILSEEGIDVSPDPSARAQAVRESGGNPRCCAPHNT